MFWIFAIAITAIACAALYYAARGRRVNATPAAQMTSDDDATTAHFQLQLREIDGDIAAGRLSEAEAVAVRAELARELMARSETTAPATGKAPAWALPGGILATAMLAFATYAFLGNPALPALPLAERTPPPPAIDLDDAMARIESQLEKTPDDARGWTVIAPVYMQQGRFADAEKAYRRLIALTGPSAELETNLGEALMMAQGGDASGEPLRLFESAAARDPQHVRSRYYIAGESTRAGNFELAVTQWTDLLKLGKGDEAWVSNAQAGLAAAQAGLGGAGALPDDAAIRGMVEGLATRLYADGGTIEEWTRLVRSRLVLGQTADAQSDYDKARQAYPDAAVRQELDVLAADNGLVSTKESQ